jgi:hypothetical protein
MIFAAISALFLQYVQHSLFAIFALQKLYPGFSANSWVVWPEKEMVFLFKEEVRKTK